MKILIVAPSWVGDMMMSHALYQLLKHQNKDHIIDVLALSWCGPLLQYMPEVNNIIEMPISHGVLALKQRYNLGKLLRINQYDQAIVLPNSFKSALIPFFANIAIRTGWKGECRYGILNDLRILNQNELPQTVQRYVALAYPKNIPVNDLEVLNPKLNIDFSKVHLIQKQFNLQINKSIIALCPGAEYGPAKCWPHYHYAKLAKRLIQEGYHVILFGSIKDASNCELIMNIMTEDEKNRISNFAGKTSLDEAIHILASCTAAVANDSGLMHIAAALQLPVVALYGPTTPEFAPPLTSRKKIIRLINTKFEKIRVGSEPFGYHTSMVNISPDLVFDNLTQLIKHK